MNPNQQPPQSTGSFGAAAGGMSPALAQLMQRANGQGANPPMTQVTNTAPTFDPNTQPPGAPANMQQPMSQPTPQPSGPLGASTATAPTPQTPYDPAEIKMIGGALANRLKFLSQLQGAVHGVQP